VEHRPVPRLAQRFRTHSRGTQAGAGRAGVANDRRAWALAHADGVVRSGWSLWTPHSPVSPVFFPPPSQSFPFSSAYMCSPSHSFSPALECLMGSSTDPCSSGLNCVAVGNVERCLRWAFFVRSGFRPSFFFLVRQCIRRLGGPLD